VSPLQSGIDVGKVAAEAACLARDMVNEPANTMTPTRMAEIAGQIAQEQGLEITVLDRSQCQELGMGAFLAVAKGSVEEPKLIVLRYWGDRQHPDNNLGIVGKGITFDSGGLNLKALYDKLYEMKGDMAGGAAVLAAIKAIAQLKPKLNVTAIVPATENMPSGSATRAGDIVRAMNGKSVEIENTDAEGRLALADAVCYARKLGLRRLVDVATLTGAITIALGDVRMGAFGNNQEWTDMVLRAGQAAGEPMWPFPLDDEYKEQNKSKVADIKNTGGRPAGSITGALFIGEFAEDTPWVHLDIAGVNMRDKERGYLPAGATGIAVRSLVGLALDLARG
jgi:leucyl aminopeptidase